MDALVSITPDHKAIRVQLQLENDNRGHGLWKFNNSLLEDEIYVKLITDNYAVIQNKYSGIEGKRLKWELISDFSHNSTIPVNDPLQWETPTKYANLIRVRNSLLSVK